MDNLSFDKKQLFLKIYNESLTYEGHRIRDRYTINGLNLSIEYKKGQYRYGEDKDGNKWKTEMYCDYGYILGTVGHDQDHVDCFVKSKNSKSEKVYVIHQNHPDTHTYDEDKVMIGFSSRDEAIRMYRKQYDRPSFFGDCETMSFDDFKNFVTKRSNFGKKIKR